MKISCWLPVNRTVVGRRRARTTYTLIGAPEFLAQFAARFPDVDTSATRVNIGWLALQLIKNHGGSAYCPIRLVHRFIEKESFSG